ncbi:MAG: adenine deaminase [Clostridia bacterium]|nr:adenine deaminase [Clostridia bacterium]
MNVENLVNAALAVEKPELVLKNARVINVLTGEIVNGDIAVNDGVIVGVGQYSGKREFDVAHRYVAPGFINAHVHVESSMVTPAVYSMEELKWGTTTIITDPHEIANVGGSDALSDILAAADRCPINYYVMLPSCVPSTGFEHSGAVLNAEELSRFKNDPHVLGLGEMMNAVGVLQQNKEVMDKLRTFSGMVIDGHAPGYSGKELNAYAVAGIHTDHESVSYEEALEKLRCGMAVLVREGSASRNLTDIISGVVKNKIDTSRMAFCTDDKHFADICREGTIRMNIKKAIALGVPPVRAVQMATINAAHIYGLRHIGAIACGYRADMVVLDSLEDMTVYDVYKDGVPLAQIKSPKPYVYGEKLLHSVNVAPLDQSDFAVPEKEKYSVIGLIEGQIVTRKLTMTHNEVQEGMKNGTVRKITVVERHHATGCTASAYLAGYGLTHGAVATTVAHDSHNIIIVGDNDSDMLAAVRELERIDGGYTIVADGQVIGSLPLTLGGLMSLEKAENFIPALDEMIKIAYSMGINKNIDPFITLSFTALPVIPEIRITDCGLFDVSRFAFVDEADR